MEAAREPVGEHARHLQVDQRPPRQALGRRAALREELVGRARVQLVGPRRRGRDVRELVADVLRLRHDLEHPLEEPELFAALARERVHFRELPHHVGVFGREVERPAVGGHGARPLAEAHPRLRGRLEGARAVGVRREEPVDPPGRAGHVPAGHRHVDARAGERRVVEAQRRVPLGHLVGLGLAAFVAQRGDRRAEQPDAVRAAHQRLLELGERGVTEARLLVELDLGERRGHVVGVEGEDALVIRDGVPPVHAGPGVRRAGEERLDGLGARRAAGGHDRVGPVDPCGALVAALGHVPREEQARDRRRLLGRAARELAGAVLAGVVGAGRAEVARVGLEHGGVVALREALEALRRTLDVRGRRLLALAQRDHGAALGGGVARIRVDLEVLVGRAVAVGHAEREHRRPLVAADLHGQAVPSGAQGARRGEPIGIEVAVLLVAQDLDAVPEHEQSSRRAHPGGDGARRPGLHARVPHEGGRVNAGLLRGADERPEVDPAVRRRRRQRAPAHGPVVLAVVVARELERELLLLLGVVGRVDADLAVVLERADGHPVADVAEAGDPGARAVEIAPTAAGVRLEEAGVRAEGRREGRFGREIAQGLFDLGRLAAVPLSPELADGEVRHRPTRRERLRAELREARVRILASGVGGDRGRGLPERRGQRDETAQRRARDAPGRWRRERRRRRRGARRRARQSGA